MTGHALQCVDRYGELTGTKVAEWREGRSAMHS